MRSAQKVSRKSNYRNDHKRSYNPLEPLVLPNRMSAPEEAEYAGHAFCTEDKANSRRQPNKRQSELGEREANKRNARN